MALVLETQIQERSWYFTIFLVQAVGENKLFLHMSSGAYLNHIYILLFRSQITASLNECFKEIAQANVKIL